MKITQGHYQKAYELGREVYEGKMRPTDAKAKLAQAGLNPSSASDLIYILRHMLNGERYTRAMSTANTDDYLTWIRRDYGDDAYLSAVDALGKHLEYYFGLKGDRLESHRQVLAKHLALLPAMPASFDSPEEIPTSATHLEGRVRQVLVNAYERNSAARAACLAHYGYTCSVCSFDFGKVYGPTGKDFIHVHHLKEISSIAEEYEVDPIHDLRPVCPNCHAMLHKRKPAFKIIDLQHLIATYTNPLPPVL
ncbi:MAG: HNH endonuclease [Proteobacteria bacterium]|nr:MAG: HNH endonuclease [Pseudomonadota bacterium]